MKKILTTLLICLAAVPCVAQNIRFAESFPSGAADILRPRLEQMLRSGKVADAPLEVSVAVTGQAETPGAVKEQAITLELELRSGEVAEVFVLKGVGKDEADAWERAMKQFLPMSKAARGFVEKLK